MVGSSRDGGVAVVGVAPAGVALPAWASAFELGVGVAVGTVDVATVRVADPDGAAGAVVTAVDGVPVGTRAMAGVGGGVVTGDAMGVGGLMGGEVLSASAGGGGGFSGL